MQFPYGKNILITGASSGIGLASALLFAKNGYQVWGVSRSGAVPQQIPPDIHMARMDVTDGTSVSSVVETLWKEAVSLTGEGFGTVLHCAGSGIGGAAEDTPQHDAEQQFQTNYFGVLRVNRHLLPHMRERGPCMVLVMGSIAGRISIPFQSHYSASKFALEAYVEALRLEGRPLGIRATILEPGDTSTGFTENRLMTIPQGSPYEASAIKAVQKMAKDEKNGASPEKVAMQALKLASRRNPPVRSAVGVSYRLLMFAKRILPDRAAEAVIRSMYLSKH